MEVTQYRSLLLFGIMFLFGVMFSPSKSVNALTQYTEDLPSSYGSVCLVCHMSESGGGGLNSFGSDYSENDNDIEAINNLDSDGDGHTNEEELEAGTFPGDPDSAPLGIGGWTPIAVALGLVLVVMVEKFRVKYSPFVFTRH